MTRPAYSFVRDFAPAPEQVLCADRHYLLCVSRGALRLEAEGRAWSLPPARAALIAASRPIRVTIPQPVTSASVLFEPGFAPPPPAPLTVFEMSPLARALVSECGRWGDEPRPLPRLGETLFQTLAAVAWALAEQPSPTAMPTGRSPELRRALELTGADLGGSPRFGQIAADVSMTPRSLARRFEDELGMTWRGALRRLRVLRAIELLAASDAPVAEVAFTVGYRSLSGFNAAFRDLTGQSPTAYRATFRG